MDILPKYEHGKYGTIMFNLCARATKFLIKYKMLYYIISWTWGLLMSLLGLIVTAALLVFSLFTKNIKFEKYNWIFAAKAGPDYWGGFETGIMFVRDQKSTTALNQHEWGHTFQNCVFGPFVIFVSFMPSMIRYWYFEARSKKGLENEPYDAAWFEDAASQCGAYADWYLNHK